MAWAAGYVVGAGAAVFLAEGAYGTESAWFWGTAVALAVAAANLVRRLFKFAESAPPAGELILSLKTLTVPQRYDRNGERWLTREFDLAEVEQVTSVGSLLQLFRSSGKGGWEAMGAFNMNEFEWGDFEVGAFPEVVMMRAHAARSNLDPKLLAAYEAMAFEAPSAWGVAVVPHEEGWRVTRTVANLEEWADVLKQDGKAILVLADPDEAAQLQETLRSPFSHGPWSER